MEHSPFTDLINGYERLPSHPPRLPTLIELSGYPHYENVCSNILKFFFEPDGPHGLGSLLLEVLVEISGQRLSPQEIGGNVDVEREVMTQAGNRIDVLITTDNYAVLIENKIFSGIANPFEDYAEYLNSRFADRRRLMVLLTLTPTAEGQPQGFHNITHNQFVAGIRAQVGRYGGKADTRYLTFFFDFLNTLENLQVGTTMHKDFLHFVAEHQEAVGKFLSELKQLRNELRGKVTKLGEKIEIPKSPSVDVRQALYREGWELRDYLVHDIKCEAGLNIAIDTILSPTGWEIQVFIRKGGGHQELQNRLQTLGIAVETGERFTLSRRFEYEEHLDTVKTVLQNLIDKLVNPNSLGGVPFSTGIKASS